MGRGTEVVVGKDVARPARIDVPALPRGAGAGAAALLAGRGHRARAREGRCRQSGRCPAQIEEGSIVGISVRGEPRRLESVDPLLHLVRAECAVLVVPAVARAIGRGDVEFHQMNVLPDDVGRRLDLEVVELVDARHQVGVVVVDAVAGIGAHDERLRGPGAAQAGGDVAVEHQDALLAEVPPHLVEVDRKLDHGGSIEPGVADELALRARRRSAASR